MNKKHSDFDTNIRDINHEMKDSNFWSILLKMINIIKS